MQEDFRKINSHKNYSKSNLTRGERLALKSLGENKDLVIRGADKGGGVVLQDLEEYQKEAYNILSIMRLFHLICFWSVNPDFSHKKALSE